MATTLYWKPTAAEVLAAPGSSDASLSVTISIYTDALKTQLLATRLIQGSPTSSLTDLLALANAAVLRQCQQQDAIATLTGLIPTILGYAGGSQHT